MNRRSFISNCGAAVAAVMLPFGFRLRLQAPKKPKATMLAFWWQSNRASACSDEGYRNFLSGLLNLGSLGVKEIDQHKIAFGSDFVVTGDREFCEKFKKNYENNLVEYYIKKVA